MIAALFFLAAAAAALVQVHLLRRAAHPTNTDLVGFPLRLVLVGAVLVAAAAARCLAAAAAGWACAFALGAAVLARRWS